MPEWPEPVGRVAEVLRVEAVDATIQEFPQGTPTAEQAARAPAALRSHAIALLQFFKLLFDIHSWRDRRGFQN